jgi:hypothetical protein
MVNYFKPLRRKVGVVTLAMACVFMAQWLRSLIELDAIARLNENNTHLVISADGAVSWSRLWPIMEPRPSRWLYKHNPVSPDSTPNPNLNYHWRFSGLGFEFSANSFLESSIVPPYTQEVATWQVPYWSIVIPLTLLSAWLLFSKPRKRPKPDASGL